MCINEMNPKQLLIQVIMGVTLLITIRYII